MLNHHTRHTLGKCAVDLYDAGNREESLALLRKLAEASEWRHETVPPAGWWELADAGQDKVKRLAARHGR